MHVPALSLNAVAWWAAAYGDHRLLSVSIRFLHIASLVIGGGTAIITDRAILRGARGGAGRARLGDGVAPSLASNGRAGALVVVASGAAAVDRGLGDVLRVANLLVKLALVALLLVNGAGFVLAERVAAHRDVWRRLAFASAASLMLWFVLLFVGTLLTASA